MLPPLAISVPGPRPHPWSTTLLWGVDGQCDQGNADRSEKVVPITQTCSRYLEPSPYAVKRKAERMGPGLGGIGTSFRGGWRACEESLAHPPARQAA